MGDTYEDMKDMILAEQAIDWQQNIDQVIIDELWEWPPSTYYIHKTWEDRGGRKMHQLSVSGAIMDWLEKEQSQYAVSNPEWWYFKEMVNISDRLLTLLILKWAQ